MLFILTGNIQTGKTRWLERAINALEQRGIEVCGVIAPGRWIECGGRGARDTGAGAGGAYEKTGIDNMLLPGRERIVFATRNDAALRAEGYEHAGEWIPQSAEKWKKGLWQFRDEAVERVNEHFDMLAQRADDASGLLVVDEFGQMELFMGNGLSSAVALIDRGATATFAHAIIVVREQLLDAALARFSQAPWNGLEIIYPDESAERELFDLFSSH